MLRSMFRSCETKSICFPNCSLPCNHGWAFNNCHVPQCHHSSRELLSYSPTPNQSSTSTPSTTIWQTVEPSVTSNSSGWGGNTTNQVNPIGTPSFFSTPSNVSQMPELSIGEALIQTSSQSADGSTTGTESPPTFPKTETIVTTALSAIRNSPCGRILLKRNAVLKPSLSLWSSPQGTSSSTDDNLTTRWMRCGQCRRMFTMLVDNSLPFSPAILCNSGCAQTSSV